MLNGQKTVRAGDAVIGIASSGCTRTAIRLRGNFLRAIEAQPKSRVPELKNTIGDELLKVHISYGPLVQKLIKRFNSQLSTLNPQPGVRAFAHITGGGFVDNIPRVLPKTCDVVIRKGSWDMLPIFRMIEAKSGVPDAELYQSSTWVSAMVAIVTVAKAKAILKFIRAQKHKLGSSAKSLKAKAKHGWFEFYV